MFIKRYITGPIQVNTYLIADESTKDAVIIDLGGDWTKIKKDSDDLGFKISYILLTHGHFDHILGIPEMRKTDENIPVLLNEKDLFLTKNLSETLRHFRINSDVSTVKTDKFINETSKLFVGKYPVTIFSTPGHTPGGQSYLIDGNLFSGDTLFRHSIGRTDLFGGNHEELVNSIKTKLFTLPPSTVVYPGHVDYTTIEDEIKNNPYVK